MTVPHPLNDSVPSKMTAPARGLTLNDRHPPTTTLFMANLLLELRCRLLKSPVRCTANARRNEVAANALMSVALRLLLKIPSYVLRVKRPVPPKLQTFRRNRTYLRVTAFEGPRRRPTVRQIPSAFMYIALVSLVRCRYMRLRAAKLKCCSALNLENGRRRVTVQLTPPLTSVTIPLREIALRWR